MTISMRRSDGRRTNGPMKQPYVLFCLAFGMLGGGACSAQRSPPPRTGGVAPALLDRVHPDLRYARVPIPDARNAFPLWAQAAGLMVDEYDGGVSDALTDVEGEFERNRFPAGEAGRRLEAWLERNKQALDLLEAGLARGSCQVPEITGPDADLGYFSKWKKLVVMKGIRAKLRASRGAPAAALDDLCDVLRMSELTARADGALLHYLVAIAIEGRSLSGMRWLARWPEAPELVLERMAGELARQTGSSEDFAQALRVDFSGYFLPILDGIDKPDAFKGPYGRLGRWFSEHPGLLDKPATVKLAGGYLSRLMRSAKGTWRERDKSIGHDMEASVVKEGADLLARWFPSVFNLKGQPPSDEELAAVAETLSKVDNAFGQISTQAFVRPVSMTLESAFRARAEREATRAVAGIRLYALRKGRRPATLRALVDEGILPCLPEDAFSGGPLLYSDEKRLIWSVGPDEVDDGGNEEKDCGWIVP